MTTTCTLKTPEATLVYDVRGPLPPPDGRPPLFCVGAPMDASGFATLASYLTDRTVITYDPRGLGRSTRHDGRAEHTPEQNADDLHRIIEALGAGPVEMFASSGGAVSALALLTEHPGDVTTLVAHEPPLIATLPDAEQAFAAEREIDASYQAKGWGHGMAAFIAFTSWRGPFTDGYLAQPPPEPSTFGLPVEDDGSRDDPLLSGASAAVSGCRPDWDTLASSPARVVVAVGVESQDLLTGRTSIATAHRLGQEPVVFPSHHGGFLGDEFGMPGEPEAFAAKLREVLAAG